MPRDRHLESDTSVTGVDTSQDSDHDNLASVLDAWIRQLRAHSTPTLRGYVTDAASWAETLALLTGHELCGSPSDYPEPAHAGVPVRAYQRLTRASSNLTAADFTARTHNETLNEIRASAAPATARRCYASWSNLCDYLALIEWIPANPLHHPSIKPPKPPKSLPRAVPDTHVVALLTTVSTPDPRKRNPWPERDLAALALLVGCGLRASECVTVRWGDIIRNEDPLLRILGKGSKERTVPLTPEVLEILDTYHDSIPQRTNTPRPDEPIILSDRGQKLTTRSLHRLVESWYARSGIAAPKGATVHSLRHTFATTLVAAGAPLPDVQELLGHASVATTRIYTAVTSSNLMETMSTHPSRRMLRGARPDQ